MTTGYVGPNGQWITFQEAGQGSGGSPGSIVSSMLWAARPTPAAALGQILRFTDVGGGNPGPSGGLFLWSNGTRYRPIGGAVALDEVDTPNVGLANTLEQQLNPNHVAIPAGLLQDFDRIRLRISASKNGSSDSATIRLRYGPLGTAADALIATIPAPAVANQSFGVMIDFKRLSNTSWRQLGNADPSQSMLGSSTGAPASAVTVANMDTNAMFLSITMQMTVGSEIPTLQDFSMEWSASDNT